MEERILVSGIYVNVWASEQDGEPLFVFPGWNGTFAQRQYREIICALADKGFQVYAIEFPGSGKSDMPKKRWTFDDFIYLVDAIFTRYNIERASIIGHSLGSVIALRFARYFPHRVKKLVLVSAPIFPIPRQVKIPLWLFDKLFWIFAIVLKPVKLSVLVLKSIAKLLHLHTLWSPLHYSRIHRIASRLDRTYVFLIRSRGVMRKILRAFVSVSTIEDAELVSAPTLLISGEKDLLTPPRNARLIARHMENAMTYIIPDGPHDYEGVWVEQLVESIETWLKNK